MLISSISFLFLERGGEKGQIPLSPTEMLVINGREVKFIYVSRFGGA